MTSRVREAAFCGIITAVVTPGEYLSEEIVPIAPKLPRSHPHDIHKKRRAFPMLSTLSTRLRALSPSQVLAACLLLILSVRAATLEFPALVDPTEARYADVAETMYSSGNWVTPQIWMRGENVPYLGKPPLHFWLTSLVYTAVGLDEWSARLVSFLGLVVICGSLILFAKHFFDRETGFLAAIFCASSAVMFFLAGASLIDVTLSACVSVAVVGASLALDGPRSPRYMFLSYTALALAMLTKGPVGALFAGLILVPWMVLRRKELCWSNLAPLRGGALFLLIAAPWYILAEARNPGFLKYFFLHENFLRFFVRNYGDLYGTGHRYPYFSAIWMVAVSFLPWTPIVLGAMVTMRGEFFRWVRSSSPLLLAASWAFATIFLLCFMRQLHVGYILPALPGLSLIAARIVTELSEPAVRRLVALLDRIFRRSALASLTIVLPIVASWLSDTTSWMLLLIPIALGIGALSLRASPNWTRASSYGVLGLAVALLFGGALLATDSWIGEQKSTSAILKTISSRNLDRSAEISFVNWTSYSSQFYAAAWAEELDAPVRASYLDEADILLRTPENLVVEKKSLNKLLPAISSRYEFVLSEGKWAWLRLRA